MAPETRARNAGVPRAPLFRLVILLSCLHCVLTFDQGEQSARRELSALTLQPIGTIQLQGNPTGRAQSNDFYGDSVVLSGDGYRLAVGARSAQGRPGQYNGVVEVFEYNSGSWQQMGNTFYGTSTPSYRARVGQAVALSFHGTRIAIGVPGGDSANGANTGHVKVYDWDGSSWNEFAHIMDGPGKAGVDDFGSQIAMTPDGSRLVIGSRKYDFSSSITQSGLVRVYEVNSTGPGWVRVGNDYDGEPGLRQASDELGSSVAISYDGTRIAVGAQQSYDYRGSARTLVQPTGAGISWSLVDDILYWPSDASGSTNGVECGLSVSLAANGNVMSTACRRAAGNAGQVRVFEYAGGAWSQRGQSLDGDASNDRATVHVLSAGGQYIIIGAYQHATNGKVGSGQVKIFQYDPGTSLWVKISEDGGPTPTQRLKRYGWSVSMTADASRIAIGAPGSGHKGTVYVFNTGVVDCNEDPSPPPPPPVLPPPPLQPNHVFSHCSCVAESPTMPSTVCTASGDPHYINFDGELYDFYGRGLYEHARFRIAPCGCEVVVQTLLVKLTRGRYRDNSAIGAIAVRVGNDTFTFGNSGAVTIRTATVDVQLPAATYEALNATYGCCILERVRMTSGNSWAWRLILPGNWGVFTAYAVSNGRGQRVLTPTGIMYAAWLAVSDDSTAITGMHGICSNR